MQNVCFTIVVRVKIEVLRRTTDFDSQTHVSSCLPNRTASDYPNRINNTVDFCNVPQQHDSASALKLQAV